MSAITIQELRHLAGLTAMHLSDDELQKLLPQMEQIISFVGQLQEVELEEIEGCDDACVLQTREGVGTPIDREGFLANVQHPVIRGMVTLETSTNQKKG